MARWMYEGSIEDVWVRITEKLGQDLTSTSILLQSRADRVVPEPDDPAWATPSDTVRAGSQVRAAQLVTGVKINGKSTKYWVWVKLLDNPEEYICKAGYFTVR